MSVCRDCAFWQYHFPHVAGICTVGPREPLGQVAPASATLVGIKLLHEHEGCTATWHSTTCANWEPVDDLPDIPYVDADGEHSFYEDGEDDIECL